MSVQLSAPELQARCAEPAPPLLLDVREPWEHQLARIEPHGVRTRHIPMGEVPQRLSELDAAQPVVVYCHHGMRSLQVVAFLRQQGFVSVYNLAGGIEAWSAFVDPAVPRY